MQSISIQCFVLSAIDVKAWMSCYIKENYGV